MSMYDKFKTNSDLEKEGVIHDYGDFRITIARAGGSNSSFVKMLEAKSRPHRRAIQTESMDSVLADNILRETYAAAVILNWEVKNEAGEFEEGIEAEDGSILPFTTANVSDTLKNLPDLFKDIQEQASKAALYLQSIQELEAGN